AEVRICEAALSRTAEECHSTVRGVRAGESVLGAEKTVALGTGLARERRLLITGEPPKQAEDRKKPNPSACTGLAEHLLPRRHGLIQSFPRAYDAQHRLVGLASPRLETSMKTLAVVLVLVAFAFARSRPESDPRLKDVRSIFIAGNNQAAEKAREEMRKDGDKGKACFTLVS